jgi:hypothetical protein
MLIPLRQWIVSRATDEDATHGASRRIVIAPSLRHIRKIDKIDGEWELSAWPQ